MVIKLKWLWKNKKDEDQTVIRNKVLVAKGYAIVHVIKHDQLKSTSRRLKESLNTDQKRTEYQLADMFMKAIPEDRLKYLVRRIGMRCLTPADLEVLTNETA
ncbi:hypothetical protein Tco_0944916 [Tanacetum coccineum]